MFPERERVRKSSKKLKGSHFGISEQFPKESVEARRKLIPELKKARAGNKAPALHGKCARVNRSSLNTLYLHLPT